MTQNTKTPAMVLQELTVKLNISPPEYTIVNSICGTHENRFDYQVRVHNIEARGTGSSKQISKHDAANNALKKLEDLGLYNRSSNPVQEFNSKLIRSAPDTPNRTLAANFIGPLKDLCMENKIPDPIFTQISDVGPPHCREFTWECQISSIKTQATGNTKKMAKQLAAQEMLERIKDLIPELSGTTSHMEKNALMECADEAKKKYNELSPFPNVVLDKSVPIEDYCKVLKKLMMLHSVEFKDFRKEFTMRDEESFVKILDKLELTHIFRVVQVDPTIGVLSLSTDTPFATIGIGDDKEGAKEKAVEQAFELMSVFMTVDV